MLPPVVLVDQSLRLFVDADPYLLIRDMQQSIFTNYWPNSTLVLGMFEGIVGEENMVVTNARSQCAR